MILLLRPIAPCSEIQTEELWEHKRRLSVCFLKAVDKKNLRQTTHTNQFQSSPYPPFKSAAGSNGTFIISKGCLVCRLNRYSNALRCSQFLGSNASGEPIGLVEA